MARTTRNAHGWFPIVCALLLGPACDEAKTGAACKTSAQCPDKNACFAKICVEHGSKHLVDITLVDSDHDGLSCAAPEIAGLRCSHGGKQERLSTSPARTSPKRLQPVTTKNQLTLLVANLWQQPPVAAKLDQRRADKQGPRFTASCQVVVRGSVQKARVQWAAGESWTGATHVPVVVADSCTVK